MTKVELESKITNLEAALRSSETNSKTLLHDLKNTNRQLKDIGKIKITKETVMEIREAVEEVFRMASFDDVDSYEVEFEIDYNNSLALGNISYNDQDNVAEAISDAIEDLFNIIEE